MQDDLLHTFWRRIMHIHETHFLHFIFRLSPAYMVVFADVLNNTVESSEDTKLVWEFTEIFLH